MSGVRVLVGTRKGAFILTSDGKREQLGRQRPPFRGLGDLPRQGLARGPGPAVRVAVQRLVRADDPALRRRRQDVGAGGQQVRLRRGPRHPPVVRRHAAPLGVQAGLASRAVADRSGYRLRRGGGRRPVPLGRRRADVAGAPRAARARLGAPLAAGRRRDVPAHHPARPERSRADLHRHLGRGRVPDRRRRQDLAADQPRPEVRGHPRPERRGRPLRPPHRDAPVAPGRAVHAEALGRHAQRRRRRFVARGQRQPADRLRVPDRRPRARAGDHLRRPDQERLRALPARGEAARLPQPDAAATSGKRSPTGCRRATATSTCCATRWRSTRSIRAASTSAPPAARSTRRPTPATPGRRSSAIFRPSSPSRSRRCHDPRRAPAPSADPGARRRRGGARGRGPGRPSARSSTPSRPPIRCCAGRSATTSRSSAGRS